MCIFDAQYEQSMQLNNGTPTRLGDIDNKLNMVGTHARARSLSFSFPPSLPPFPPPFFSPLPVSSL